MYFLFQFLTYNYIYFINVLILIWPQWLCFDWSMGCIPLIETILDVRILLIILFWILGLFVSYKVIKDRNKLNCLALCLIIIPFIPASNLLFRVGFVIAERVLFIPSVGLCLLVANGWNKLKIKLPYAKVYLAIGYWLLICAYGLRTNQRAKQWLSEKNLFLSALDVCSTNAKVHYNIAKVSADEENFAKAELEYRIALKLYPRYDQAMNNLANLLRSYNQLEEAEKLLRQAIEIRPDFAAAWMNLGIVLATLGKDNEAEKCYKEALSHRNKYSDCYYNLGNLVRITI